jgi:hypothetical protein
MGWIHKELEYEDLLISFKLISTYFHIVPIEILSEKNYILKFSYNYVRNRSRNRMKENKKLELEPEPDLCQNGMVPQHC